MKKSLAYALTGMLAMLGTQAFAQNGFGTGDGGPRSGALEWGFGVKGGVNSARAEIEPFEDEQDRLGFNAGVQFELGTNRPFSLSFEPTYVVKGAEFNIEDAVTRSRLDYLEFPLLAKLNIPLGRYVRLFGMAGPNVAVNTDADFDEEALLSDDDVEPIDVLLDVGGGTGIRFSPAMSLLGQVRYSHGFMDILEEDTEPVQNWNVRDLKVSAGLLWNFPAG